MARTDAASGIERTIASALPKTYLTIAFGDPNKKEYVYLNFYEFKETK